MSNAKIIKTVTACGVLSSLGGMSAAQSLLIDPPQIPMTAAGDPDPAGPMRSFSMMAVDPPAPRTFAVNDLITIVIDETSRSSVSQSLETEQRHRTDATLGRVLDPLQLLQLRLRMGDSEDIKLLDAQARRDFEGDGDYRRDERFNTRITARVIDVKPNGTMVLEARRQIGRDDEISTLVLTGICRRQDVTRANTVLSSQLADLRLVQHNHGHVKRAASKGPVTTMLDRLFNF
ncbi:MAG: flagellar basal body L-ring protein FlgH [Phycisphaerales bacterium]|nr:flagellar basal body L-ring protein FlgH [Phycisphaerales bacterium]